eukprot:SAG25_NODE_38_length_19656_cov_132.022038_1_plen_30_part_10
MYAARLQARHSRDVETFTTALFTSFQFLTG